MSVSPLSVEPADMTDNLLHEMHFVPISNLLFNKKNKQKKKTADSGIIIISASWCLAKETDSSRFIKV